MDGEGKTGRFRKLGEVGLAGAGLSARRIRELELAAGWRRVAGAAVARRAVPVAIRRGTLVIEVRDGRWAAALRPLVPRLAARLAALRPELRIRRLRITGTGAWGDGSAEALPEDPGTRPAPRERRAERPSASGDPLERLRAAAERCLERGSMRGRSGS